MNSSFRCFTLLRSLLCRARRFFQVSLASAFIVFGLASLALAEAETHTGIDLTTSPVGYFALCVFVLAYVLVMSEEFTHLRKSKPVILAVGIIWTPCCSSTVSSCVSAGFDRLYGLGLTSTLLPVGSNLRQHLDQALVGDSRQEPDHVRGVDHKPGHFQRPMVTRDADCRSWGKSPLHWICSWCRADGAGERELYVFRPSQMDSGDCAWVWRKHSCAHVDQCPHVLSEKGAEESAHFTLRCTAFRT